MITKFLNLFKFRFLFVVTSDPFTATDLAAMISETWTDIVNEKTFNDTVLANFCTDLSSYATEGSDIFHVPNIYTNALTVSTQSTQGAEVTTASPADTDTTLTINTHRYVAFIIGDKDLQQLASRYDANAMYAREAVKLLTEALEQDLAGLWSSITTNAIGDTATVLSDAEIRAGIYSLEALKYHLDECAFFFHPLAVKHADVKSFLIDLEAHTGRQGGSFMHRERLNEKTPEMAMR